MSGWMRRVLESKRETRKRLAVLPFSEKVILLEKLRDRSLLIASSPLRQQPRRGWPRADQLAARSPAREAGG